MALLITHAILHILNNAGPGACFSSEELDIDSEVCSEFILKHVRKLMRNPSAREATFSAESEVYSMVRGFQKGDLYFKDFSLRLCERLYGIMQENKDIPPADVLVAAFDQGQDRFLAILKLNYTECFTHRVVEDEAGADNQIVKNTAVLPFTSGRVEEACLIPYDPMMLRVLEKPYVVNGEDMYYFSQLFLQCETALSKKETVEIIQQIAEEINARYFDDDVEIAAKLDCAFVDEAEEAAIADEDSFILENVVRRVFPENEAVKTEFVEMAKEAGLPHQVRLDKPFVKQQFKTQRFKADNGIEIKCPSELFGDPEIVQLITNGDGTISITLKNLRKTSV